MKKTSVSAHRCLCMRALKAMPSFQLVVKFVMLTLGYLHNKSQAMSLSLHSQEMQSSNNMSGLTSDSVAHRFSKDFYYDDDDADDYYYYYYLLYHTTANGYNNNITTYKYSNILIIKYII